jgi:putative nucleotidyltransferase with HDIG domain
MSTTITLDEIVSRTPDLPSMPTAVLAVMKEVESATSSAHTVARTLAQDQALSARVLRLANSAFYGLPRQVTQVSEAVVLLGMRCVKNLALVASTYPWLTKPLKGYNLGPKELWRHSFGVAVGAEVIAKHTRCAATDEAFTAGLLHNLGKVALSIWMEDRLVGMLALAAKENLTFDEVERRVLGYDHAEVGAHMGESWNLPRVIVDVLRNHHHPNTTTAPNVLVDCVHLADYLTMSLGIGLGGDGLKYELCEDSFARLGLTPESIDELADKFNEEYSRHESMFDEDAAA